MNTTWKVGDKSNLIKVRDDSEPVAFTEEAPGKFKIAEGAKASWLNSAEFGMSELRSRVEPWLTSLVQSEHLSLLAGSGLTHAVHGLAVGKAAAGMGAAEINKHGDKIKNAAKKASEAAGRREGNVEDQFRAANELLRGLQILEDETSVQLKDELTKAFKAFASSILKSERAVAEANLEQREAAFNALVSFLMSFSSRTGARDRLNIFTTNYDRFIEAGAEIAGLHLLDRFLGSLMPIFRSSRLELDIHYNPPGIRGEPRYLEGVARFTKLHGSVDWIQAGGDIRRVGIPFGARAIEPYLDAPGLSESTAHELMIYPNASKDRETADYPYVDLFRDFATAVCRPNSTLVCYGYSFGDEHINRVIRDMLTIPSAHLVVVAYDDPLGRVMRTYEEIGRPSQITLLLGPALANLENLTSSLLPKAAIDKTTFRMGELLRQRFHAAAGPTISLGPTAVEDGAQQ
jgi:hypothetical protein